MSFMQPRLDGDIPQQPIRKIGGNPRGASATQSLVNSKKIAQIF